MTLTRVLGMAEHQLAAERAHDLQIGPARLQAPGPRSEATGRPPMTSTIHTTNRGVARAFAEDREAQGGGNLRTIRTETGALVLVSYATPIALRVNGSAIVDEQRYSVTTSKQLSGIWVPLSMAGIPADYVEHGKFREACKREGVSLSWARD
jgi:hypothetical protein